MEIWKIVKEQKEAEVEQIITEHNLKSEETKTFIDNALRDGALKTTGTDIDKILPAVSIFGFGGGNRKEIKEKVVTALQKFFEKYFGLL